MNSKHTDPMAPYEYMPIQGTPFLISADHLSERQAKKNHSQSLRRLAERRGVSPREALALMTESPWQRYRDWTEMEALQEILDLRREWIEPHPEDGDE